MELVDLITKVKNAGVVGAGGAGFPTHQKLNNRCEVIIINGAECEPLSQVDQLLLKLKAEVLLGALETIVKISGARVGIIALKAKDEETVETLRLGVSEKAKVELFFLEDFYPAGDEHVLVYEVLGKVVPPGGIPLQVGVLVLNVETLLNIAQACHDQPVVSTYVTVAGAVNNPATFSVPIGMSIDDLLQHAGGPSKKEYQVLDGGAMMGKLVEDRRQGVTKTTKSLLVLPESHKILNYKRINLRIALKRAMAACCQCTACTDLCPRYLLGHHLEPHRMLRILGHNLTHDLKGVVSAQLCCECGVCDLYACTMELSPRLLNAAVKKELNKHKFKLIPGEEPEPHFERKIRKIPSKRLIFRLGLGDYCQQTFLIDEPVKTNQVGIALKQHVGAPCYPLVKPGEKVITGQVIAQVAEEETGSFIHASISGTVTQIFPEVVIMK